MILARRDIDFGRSLLSCMLDRSQATCRPNHDSFSVCLVLSTLLPWILATACWIGLAPRIAAAPIATTLNFNQTRHRVPISTNLETLIPGQSFYSDSLAISANGTLFSADPSGVIWNVTGVFSIPVGPTGRTQIADLVMGSGGLWGFSNASQELFFFDLGSSSVTSAQIITGISGHTITGVAYQMSTGDIYLTGYAGMNNDTLFRIASAATVATTVGSMVNGEPASYFVDLEFGADGTLYAVSFIYRWFYSVSTTNASTAFLSSGAFHRDVTAMAIRVPAPVPEPGAMAILSISGCLAAGCRYRQRR
jgi:hypothetical protein